MIQSRKLNNDRNARLKMGERFAKPNGGLSNIKEEKNFAIQNPQRQ